MRLFVVGCLALMLGCSKNDPPPKKAAPTVIPPAAKVVPPPKIEEDPNKLTWKSKSVWSGVPAYLVRIDTKNERTPAATLWKNLPSEMAKDPESMKFLGGMLKTDKLTFAAHEKKEDDFKPPEPKEPGEAYLAIWPSNVRAERGTGSEVHTLYLNNGLYIAGPTRRWPEGVSEVKLLIWTINDFLLRHDRGYILRHGFFSPFDTDSEKQVADIEKKKPEEFRKELDAAIEKVKE